MEGGGAREKGLREVKDCAILNIFTDSLFYFFTTAKRGQLDGDMEKQTARLLAAHAAQTSLGISVLH